MFEIWEKEFTFPERIQKSHISFFIKRRFEVKSSKFTKKIHFLSEG